MKLTVRGRLTLVYGGLFLAFGVVMLGVTYVLVSQRVPTKTVMSSVSAPGPARPEPEMIFKRIAEDTRDDALGALLTQGGIALLVVGAIAIALGWLVAGRMLQPLHQITATARRIAESPAADRGLHERIALTGPDDEIKQLADTFDLMLTRLDRSFDGQRRFIANASHELRTPLTLNRTLLEVALQQESASPEVRQLGTTLLAINDRHGRLIDGLLMLARSERELTEHSYVDLADIASHVSSDDVRTELGEAATVGDPVLLERLVQNLVDNAVRHNVPEGGWVRVVTYEKEGLATLEVSNTGQLVPRYEIEALFEPFRRLGTDRIAGPGVGLGLSIVRAVARAHGGEVHAVPREEGGLVVTVTLPAAQAWL
ncbi:sensor histidine kinase [Actinoplanes friuliensis]|uniref:histidine kinase n=1 Tax=Actinoplanes friuliensis DSM 7358 TaxID=1246995 RepID=U5VVJ5_9ACTN|nr:HAMP domain-containing sensor histidine kinase [Actinoplanes friuliensis]AGZ39730.1 integral membrane sensor signal transduction histidine kinase [Actinoplanes friuliensis DSM 7358]